MVEPSITALLPPLLAIGLSLATRQVYLALFAGVWLGYFLLLDQGVWPAFAESLDRIIGILGNEGDARIVAFTLVIGAFMYTLERSGAIKGFVSALERQQWVNSPKRAQWLSWVLGVVIFIESNITVLVSGTVSRPLYDRFKISREKLAYIIDSTSAPICILIPLNAWGAFNLGLLEGLGVEDALSVLIYSIPMNLYALTAVALAAFTIARSYNPGPMAKAENREQSRTEVAPSMVVEEGVTPKAINMVLPVAVLVIMMFVGLYITGNGELLKGSGSTSVLWASMAALAVLSTMILIQRLMPLNKLTDIWMTGAGKLLPLAVLLILALALGSVAKELGAGQYVAAFVGEWLPVWMLPVAIFWLAGVIAFSVGSSWGTFSIMLPIAIPIALHLGINPSLLVAAVLSGGIFGDHSSPISDTTIISSLAAGTQLIDHVQTQLPYALIAGAIASIGFVVLGVMI